MYTTIDQIPSTASKIAASLERIESAIYRADAVFQAEVLPLAAHSLIVSAHLFVQAVVHTYVAGVCTRRWYDAYNQAAVPVVETEVIIEPQLALPAAPEQLALPAVIAPHPDHERIMRRVAKAGIVSRMIDPAAPEQVLVTPASVVHVAVTEYADTRTAVARLDIGIRELRKLAKERGVKSYSKMSKATLLSLLAV